MKTLPAVNQAEDAAETLALVCDALGIGEMARSRSTILTNIENARRRADCLWRVEHEFFMVSEPDEDEPDGPPFETCLLNWGDDPDHYVKKFGEVLAAGRVPVEFLEQIRRSCGVAGFESNDDSQEQKRWYDLRDQAARILGSRAVPFALVAEPTDNEDTIREAVKRIDQLGVTLCKSLTKPGIDRMAAGMDFHNAVETELRGMLATPSGGAGCSVNAGLDSASIKALIEKYGSQAHPHEGNGFTTGDLPLVKAVIAAMHGGEPVDFTTLGAAEQQQFPPRILSLLREVADRKGTATRAPWEDESGERMQNDADAAIAWIEAQTKQAGSGHLVPSASGGI